MKITARLFATLRMDRQKDTIVDIHENATILDLVNMFELDVNEVAIILINGKDGKLDSILSEGDVVSLFPPVGGG